jgi:hypothetical protein
MQRSVGLAVAVFVGAVHSAAVMAPPGCSNMGSSHHRTFRPLYQARVDGGTGNPIGADTALSVDVTRADNAIADVEMRVDGRRLRAEDLYVAGAAARVIHTFTLHPRISLYTRPRKSKSWLSRAMSRQKMASACP